MERRQGRECRRELDSFRARQGMGRGSRNSGLLEHLENGRRGTLDPRLERRSRVQPVAAQDVCPRVGRGVVVGHSRHRPSGDETEEAGSEKPEKAHESFIPSE